MRLPGDRRRRTTEVCRNLSHGRSAAQLVADQDPLMLGSACLSYFERVPGVGASHTLSAYPA